MSRFYEFKDFTEQWQFRIASVLGQNQILIECIFFFFFFFFLNHKVHLHWPVL